MAERDHKPLQSEVLQSSGRKNSSSDENGHVDSPDETLSPTSVIYFKEALHSSNLQFGKTGSVSVKTGSVSVSPLRKYDFKIERIDSRQRSKC